MWKCENVEMEGESGLPSVALAKEGVGSSESGLPSVALA